MLLFFLIIFTILLIVLSFYTLGKKWFSPFFLFVIPFLIMYIVALINSKKWSLQLNIETFIVFFMGELLLFIGCILGNKGKRSIFKIEFKSQNNKIFNSRLIILILVEIFLILYQLISLLNWGSQRGFNLLEAINANMIYKKFNTGDEPLNMPMIIGVLTQINFISSFIFAYLIARKIVFKDGANLLLLVIGFIVSVSTNLLGGSRGPIIESLLSIIIASGCVYFQKTRKNIFSLKVMMSLMIVGIIGFIAFFAMLPLLGREHTAGTITDEIAQYIGAQVYNMNYFITEKKEFSTFFGANTFSGIYSDIETFFNIDLGYSNAGVDLFFVRANGYELGNVFTCYFSFYTDFGLIGIIFPFLIGFLSQKIFLKAINDKNIINVSMVVYIYISVFIVFSFFGERFFTNLFNLKMIIKIFWLYFIYWFISKSKISILF